MPGGMGGTQLPMGKAVYQAACDGNEAELRRLIRLGGSVNCHIPEVRLRMPRVLVALSLRRQRRVRTSQLHVTRGADGFAAAPPTRRPSHARPRRSARLSSIDRPQVTIDPFSSLDRLLRSQDSDSTALMVGSAYGREGCVQLLLDSGATVNDTNVSAELLRCPVASLFAYVRPMNLPVISLCISL